MTKKNKHDEERMITICGGIQDDFSDEVMPKPPEKQKEVKEQKAKSDDKK